MEFSEQYLALLQDFEGFYSKPYVCTGGACTIGYGTNLEAHKKFIPYSELKNTKLKGKALCSTLTKKGMTWDKSQATEAMLDELLTTHTELVKRCKAYIKLREKGDHVRADCLLDMAYNMGVSSLLTFKATLSNIEKGNYEQASICMKASLWYKQVGRRARALCQMMRTGKYVKPSEVDSIK